MLFTILMVKTTQQFAHKFVSNSQFCSSKILCPEYFISNCFKWKGGLKEDKRKKDKYWVDFLSVALTIWLHCKVCYWCTVERLPSRRGSAKTSFLLIKYLSNRYFATIAIYKVFFSL